MKLVPELRRCRDSMWRETNKAVECLLLKQPLEFETSDEIERVS